MIVKKRIASEIQFQIARIIAQFIYFTGLTALIPLITLALHPLDLFNARYALFTALFFIFVSITLVFLFANSRKEAFFSIGLMTLIPGALAVIFSFVGEKKLIGFVSHIGIVTPFIEQYVQTYVPKTWVLAGVYIMIGTLFVWVSQE